VASDFDDSELEREGLEIDFEMLLLDFEEPLELAENEHPTPADKATASRAKTIDRGIHVHVMPAKLAEGHRKTVGEAPIGHGVFPGAATPPYGAAELTRF
jgi:hypothetical protein